MTVTDFPAAITLLSAGRVEYIVIGGVAATIHGSAHITYDLDVLYRRTPENIERLATTLAPIRPYLRGAPEGLPFHLDAATITRVSTSRRKPRSGISTCSAKSPEAGRTSNCFQRR